MWCELPEATLRGGILGATVAATGKAQRASQMSYPIVADVSISWQTTALSSISLWRRPDHDWSRSNGSGRLAFGGEQPIPERAAPGVPGPPLWGHCRHTPGALKASCIRNAKDYDTPRCACRERVPFEWVLPTGFVSMTTTAPRDQESTRAAHPPAFAPGTNQQPVGGIEKP